jgi:type II secretory pathway predicted ATPase ExeA
LRRLNGAVVEAERDTPSLAAAQRMRDQHAGRLVVVGKTGSGRLVVGRLTDHDIVTGVIAKAVDAATLRVEDVMATDVVTAKRWSDW